MSQLSKMMDLAIKRGYTPRAFHRDFEGRPWDPARHRQRFEAHEKGELELDDSDRSFWAVMVTENGEPAVFGEIEYDNHGQMVDIKQYLGLANERLNGIAG